MTLKTPRTPRAEVPSPDVALSRMTPQRKRRRHVAVILLLLLGIGILVLTFTPYQQTVVGNGRVGVYSVMDRPQTIDAQIGGQLVAWKVQEGEIVQKGQLLAQIKDTESRFLSPERIAQLRKQLLAQRQRKIEETERIKKLEAQIVQLQRSQPEQIAAASAQERQAQNSKGIAQQSLNNAEKQRESVQKVAVAQAAENLRQAKVRVQQANIRVGQAQVRVQQAQERLGQTQDRVLQAQQTVKADTISLDVQRLQRERIARLYKEGLRSGREDELAERDLVAAQTKLAQSKQAVEIASRDVTNAQSEVKNLQKEVDNVRKEVENAERQVKVVEATNIQADIQVQQAINQTVASRAALLNASESIRIAGNNRNRITADTQGSIVGAEGNLQMAKASIAQLDDSISKAELELDNMEQRRTQESIFAPIDGRVSRIGKTIGRGQTVKKDDELLEIVPETKDQAVELLLSELDAPLVSVGRTVRIQFVGFPAATVPGFPQTMVGTFAGVVTNIDPVDDGSGKIRAWVKPDGTNNEKPWPNSTILRPGTLAIGWIQLDTVSLWYELWRQFNGFSPNFRDKAGFKSSDDGKGGKKEKPFKDGSIKLPKR
jgi:multidrug resistance efflux pump